MGENKKEMQVASVLHMNQGSGETSYARNSTVQKNVLDITKSIREEAIRKLYTTTFPKTKSLAIADLGCASGPNMLSVVRDFLTTFDGIRQETNHQHWGLEFQVFLNDLPCNDFNTVFRSIPGFKEQLEREMGPEFGSCFINGAPGSFYGRLFPCESLHFIHSSFGLHWLSRIPEGVTGNNKENINTASSSPESVAKAYCKQFQVDFSTFLRCRSEEMVKGGCMVFTLLGRKSEDPRCNEYGYMWELLGMTLNQMTSEGLIKEEKMKSFNIPVYTPTLDEITTEIAKITHFTVIHTETFEVTLCDADKDCNYNTTPPGKLESGNHQKPPTYDKYLCIARSVRAVAEPMIVSHFGNKRLCVDEVFRRYEEIVRDCMSEEKSKLFNITVSLAKNIV